MSILLIFLAMFFAALTVWAGRRLHRLLNPRAHVTELQRRVYMLPHWRLAGQDCLYRMIGQYTVGVRRAVVQQGKTC